MFKRGVRNKIKYVHMLLLVCFAGAIILISQDNAEETNLIYSRILEDRALPDGTSIEAVAYAFVDFNKDDVPELLLQKGYYDEGHPILGECNGLTIISIEDGKPTVVYEDQCILICIFQDKQNLILSYPNSSMNPVEILAYSQGEFTATSYIYSGKEGYVSTSYDKKGNAMVEVLEADDYPDTFAIVEGIYECERIEFQAL